METIVLDYCAGSVSIFEHENDVDVEEFLEGKGICLGDCEWMSCEKVDVFKG
jgi:hypothetical protein